MAKFIINISTQDRGLNRVIKALPVQVIKHPTQHLGDGNDYECRYHYTIICGRKTAYKILGGATRGCGSVAADLTPATMSRMGLGMLSGPMARQSRMGIEMASRITPAGMLLNNKNCRR